MRATTLDNSIKALKTNKNYIILLCIYSFILLFFCSKMSPLYPINDWSDVNIYFNIGKAIFNGHTLYSESFDHKGPLIFFIYGIGYLISNTSFLGVFIIEVIAWTIMLNAVFFSAKLFLNKQFSVIVAFLFPILLFFYTEQGGSAEEFILVFESISLYFFLRYLKNEKFAPHSYRVMFLHGMMSSMAFLTKLNLLVFWFFPLLFIFINILVHKQYINFIKNALGYIAGSLIIILPALLYFVINDSLFKAYDVYIALNSSYASIPESFKEIIILLLNRIYLLLRNNPLVFFLILTGIFFFPYKYFKSWAKRLAYMFCGISTFLIISITRSFFNYYNIPLCVFLVPGLIAFLSYIQDYVTVRKSKQFVKIMFVIAILYSANIKQFFKVGGEVFFNKDKATGVICEFGKLINKEANPTLLNLGFGYGNAIFTYCNIVPSFTYSMTPNIPHNLYPELRNEQTKYIENKEPTFIILTNASMNYDYFKELAALNENYEKIDTYVDTDSYFKNTSVFYTYYLYKRKE